MYILPARILFLSCDLTSTLHRTTCRRVNWRTAISARTRPRKCSRPCPTSPSAVCLVHSTSTLYQLRSLPTLLYSHLSTRATATSFPHLKKNHLVQGAIYQEPYEVLMHTNTRQGAPWDLLLSSATCLWPQDEFIQLGG